MATRGKYQSLTLKRKLEILDEVEKTSSKKKKDIASHFGIPPSTLSTLLKDKDKIRSSQVAGRSKRKRNRDASRQDVDAALFRITRNTFNFRLIREKNGGLCNSN